MRIGCFGVTANPPRLGHQEAARIVLRSGYVDMVWLIPVFVHPFDKPDFASFEHRFRMSKFLEEPGIHVCAVESEISGTSYTIDTIRYLRRKFPNDTFYWCIGSDIVAKSEFLDWHNWPELEKEVSFLVVERPNFPFGAQLLPSCFTCIGRSNDDVSSTEVRNMIRAGKDIKPYVGKDIAEYIKNHKLYTPKEV